MEALKKHQISFKNAFAGLRYSFTSQPNFKIHFILSLLAILTAWWVKISYAEMTILILTIVFGLGAEMINTSLEAMTDLITQEYKKEAKIAKDVAAGMMLLTAFGAVIIALLIIGPKILERF